MLLRKARKGARLKRQRVPALIASLITEIEAINADPELIAWVDEADIFGSVLTDAEEVGDIDVAIKTAKRPVNGDWFMASAARASAAGVRGNFILRIDWGQQELWRRLRRVSRYLDLDWKDDIVTLDTPLRELYRRTPPAPRTAE